MEDGNGNGDDTNEPADTRRCIEQLARTQAADAQDDRGFPARQALSVFGGRYAAFCRDGLGKANFSAFGMSRPRSLARSSQTVHRTGSAKWTRRSASGKPPAWRRFSTPLIMRSIIVARDTCICERSASSRRPSGSVTNSLWTMAAVRRAIPSRHGSRSHQ
jgi:hypothetical protein